MKLARIVPGNRLSGIVRDVAVEIIENARGTHPML